MNIDQNWFYDLLLGRQETLDSGTGVSTLKKPCSLEGKKICSGGYCLPSLRITPCTSHEADGVTSWRHSSHLTKCGPFLLRKFVDNWRNKHGYVKYVWFLSWLSKVTMTFHSLLEKNCETFETIHEHMKRACQTLKQCLLRQCPFLFCLMLTFFFASAIFYFSVPLLYMSQKHSTQNCFFLCLFLHLLAIYC